MEAFDPNWDNSWVNAKSITTKLINLFRLYHWYYSRYCKYKIVSKRTPLSFIFHGINSLRLVIKKKVIHIIQQKVGIYKLCTWYFEPSEEEWVNSQIYSMVFGVNPILIGGLHLMWWLKGSKNNILKNVIIYRECETLRDIDK